MSVKMVFLLLVLSYSSLLFASEGHPEKHEQGIFVKGSWLCENGKFVVKFTLINKNDQAVEMLADRLPWSITEGGAEVILESFANAEEQIVAQRPSIDFTKKTVVLPGEMVGQLAVETLFPQRDEFVKRHKKVSLKWRYKMPSELVSVNGKSRTVSSGVRLDAEDAKSCIE